MGSGSVWGTTGEAQSSAASTTGQTTRQFPIRHGIEEMELILYNHFDFVYLLE
jgi:hypothetical protein